MKNLQKIGGIALFGVKKKNIYVGIIVHILCNMMNVVTGIAFMVRMT